MGQIAIDAGDDGLFALTHRDDASHRHLAVHTRAEDAEELARFDDIGNYRALKTAPNLRHGWRLSLTSVSEVHMALDLFYPGRLAAFFAWEKETLEVTPLRDTLARQTGMYRVAAKIGEDEANALVGNFCRSDGGCLRTILWPRDKGGTIASTVLPPEKFDPQHHQTIPLLCQEACNLLVAEARKIVKGDL